MSLVTGYSSGEDDAPEKYTRDAFALLSIPAAKKVRVEDISGKIIPIAAPDVLSEVRTGKGARCIILISFFAAGSS
jgi:hypothetical protein